MHNFIASDTALAAYGFLISALHHVLKEYKVTVCTMVPNNAKMPYLHISNLTLSDKGMINHNHLCMDVTIHLYSDSISNVEILEMIRLLQRNLEESARNISKLHQHNADATLLTPCAEIASLHFKDISIRTIDKYNWWYAMSLMEIIIINNPHLDIAQDSQLSV